MENLTSLNLSQNERISNRGAAALAALGNLRALNLSNTRVNSGALRFFSSLVRLQSLALYGCEGVDDDSVSILQNELPSLKCLRLQHSNIPTSNDIDEDNSFSEDDESDEHMLLLAETDGIRSDESDAESLEQDENISDTDNNDNQFEDFHDLESHSSGVSHFEEAIEDNIHALDDQMNFDILEEREDGVA